MTFVYKIERNSRHSKRYVVRKFLRHEQPKNFRIEDSSLGIVSNLLSYHDAEVACNRFNSTLLAANRDPSPAADIPSIASSTSKRPTPLLANAQETVNLAKDGTVLNG
jgi:hypothetical protein